MIIAIMDILKSKKNILSLCILFFVGSAIFARGAQELIEESWVYDAATAIFMEAGVVNFSDSTPITIAEMKSYLREVNREELSKAGKAQYDRIFEYFGSSALGLESSLLSLTTEPSINLEGYYKTNDDIAWVFDRYERNPVIDLPVTFALSDFVTMKMDLYLSQNKNTMLENDTYTNVPIEASQFDVNFPDSAYLSTGYSFSDECGIEFMFGSPSRSIGRTGTSSLIYSENVTGATAGQLSLYSPNLKYTASVTQLGTYSDIHTNKDDINEYEEYETSNGAYLYMHQIEARLFKRLTLTAVEGFSVYAPFEMRYLNPFTIMHGYAAWRDYGHNEAYTSDYFGLKFNYVPARYWRVYGLFAMSQFQTPYELDIAGDDVTPNGLGGQLGAEGYFPLGDGYLHFTLDGCYTQPYLYIREAAEWSLIRYYRENMGSTKYVFYEWVGSPFGPDTISAELSAAYEIPSISLRGTINALNILHFTLQPSYVIIRNNEHKSGENAQGFEIACSVKLDLTRLISGK